MIMLPFAEQIFGELNLLPHGCPKHQHLLLSVNYTLKKKDDKSAHI